LLYRQAVVSFERVVDDASPDPRRLDELAGSRIRSLRESRRWTLDEIADRANLSASTISRIETGHRRITLEHIAVLARALDTTVDDLIGHDPHDDVVIHPVATNFGDGSVHWPLSRANDPSGRLVTKLQIPAAKGPPVPQVHPGREWFYVLHGTTRLLLGEREVLVQAGQAAEFDTMTPHWTAGYKKPVDVLVIFDHHGERVHLRRDHA
jgi:transcriptional regulator with XRE-family HTH domain